MQSLYYYCYINNQLFVTRDDSYLDLYYYKVDDGEGTSTVASEGESE